MATGGKYEKLANRQIVRLGAAISADNMASIAEGYMDINPEIVKNIRRDENNSEAFNRAVLRYWANKHPENQVERLAALLCQAAEDCSYVDPIKIQQILDDSEEEKHDTKKCTEDELLKMAEDLRMPTADSMKMVPAPWIPKEVVDMDDLYTELALEKNDRTFFKKEHLKLENYKELFAWHNPGMLKYIDIRYSPHPFPMRKILIKGGPGMGKTSLSKKIAWDWAKRLFVKVSIVFFVFLKLVKPGDFIEDAIVQQTRKFQKKKIERKKLINILEHFGHRCLLILDGYDECALGQNEKLIDILGGLKFENCNIILTSRPHSIVDIEGYFDTIVSVEGFTRNEAQKFASRIVLDKEKVEQILNFNPAGERANRPVHNVPILLSFLCLLVIDDNIDLSDKTISMGEINFRMVQCLYKKFTIRKGIEFQLSSLIRVLMSLGKLALETLLSGNSLLQRSQIIEQVGDEVFEYGLLIGEDGFSLTRDMTVDTLVTFPHRSLQEFLGAFYFVLTFGQKQFFNHLDKAFWEYWKNPLFSEFCLWLLDEQQIDDVEVDFGKAERTYPALSLALGVIRYEIALKILEDALVKCSRIKHIIMDPRHPVDRILGSISPVTFHGLNSIQTSDSQNKRHKSRYQMPHDSPLQFLCMWHDHGFGLRVKWDLSKQHSVDALNAVLKIIEGWNRTVYLRVSGNLSGISWHLANLLDSRDMSHLAEASAHGRLPKLSTLDISGIPDIGGNLSELLSHCFPSLHTLILSNCGLQISDVNSLAKARNDARLPQLRHLDVSFNVRTAWKPHSSNITSESVLALLFKEGSPILNTLVARGSGIDSNGLQQLYRHTMKMEIKLFKLTTLDMSFNEAIGGSLSALMCQYWPHLQILVLRNCSLSTDDLTSLSRASSYGRLPELRHLDLSGNGIGHKTSAVFRLFGSLISFPSLINLVLCGCGLELQDLCCLTQARLDGKLPRIRHLDISFNGLSHHVGILSRDPITQWEISWGNVVCCEDNIDAMG